MDGAPAWFDELDLRTGPPWLSMGVRALDPTQWLVIDDRFAIELAQKDRLSVERPDEVFGTRPGTERASQAALSLVTDWLRHHHPDRLAERTISVPEAGLHPLDRAARLVQEDLCLVRRCADGTHRLDAASVCFPSHWRLADKLGGTVADIHAPVPHYDTELRTKVDRFFDRLRPGQLVLRRNLSVHNHDELFRPEPHESPDAYGDSPDEVWLRSERQTLRRLPGREDTLFTIKTQQCSLRAIGSRPDVAMRLSRKLRSLSSELPRIGATVPFPRWLPDWLDAVGSAEPN